MANTPIRHWTVLGYISPVFDYLQSLGEPLAPYLDCLGLQLDDLKNADLRVENHLHEGLFELAAQRCDDMHFGLHAGLKMQVKHIGILGLLAMSCRNVAEVFDLHGRYQTLVGDGLTSSYQLTDDAVIMTTVVSPGHPPLGRHSYEYSLAGWYQLKSQLLGSDQHILKVELPYENPGDDEISRSVDAPVSYGHDVLRVMIERSFYDAPLMGNDSSLKQMLEAQAQKRLLALRGEQADSDPEIALVRQIVAERLALSTPTLEEVAAAMDVSVRTLQRRLDQRQSSFKQLLDEVRSDLAQKYMGNEELSLLDVAMMLGFAEQSSFNRAFKRWFGESPGAYRQRA